MGDVETQRGELAVVDAQFREGWAALARIDWDAESDEAIQRAHAFERIKADSLDASDFDMIHGRRVPNAKGISKLAIPCGHSATFISRNEHGDPGVRRAIVDDLDRHGNVVKALLYTVTVRVTDKWGRTQEADASFFDRTKDDNSNRAMCTKRAVKKASEWLVGGVNAESGVQQAVHQKRAEQKPADMKDLFAVCVRRGFCPDDKAAFVDFIKERVPGCADVTAQPKAKHAIALQKWLREAK